MGGVPGCRGSRWAGLGKLGILAVLGLSACAALTGRPEPPRVSLADIRLVDASLFEQRYALKLRVQNPNAFRLPIDGLDYTLSLNGKAFAHGVSNAALSVPAYGESVITVSLISQLGDTLRQLRALSSGPGAISYSLDGGVHLGGRALTLPFSHIGEIDLGTGSRRGAPASPPPARD